MKKNILEFDWFDYNNKVDSLKNQLISYMDNLTEVIAKINNIPTVIIHLDDFAETKHTAKYNKNSNEITVQHLEFLNAKLTVTVIENLDFEASLNENFLNLYNLGWRFFVYMPILLQNNTILGFISVIDTKPNLFDTNLNKELARFTKIIENHYVLISTCQNYLKSDFENASSISAIYQSSKDACTFINKEFKIIYTNKVAKQLCMQIFGKEPRYGDNSLDYMLPHFKEEFKIYYENALQNQCTEVDKTDGKGWWTFSIFPVFDNKNSLVGIAHNVQDITERKLYELKIKEQNERFSEISWFHSHKVRAPVATILGLINIIEMEKKFNYNYVELLKKAANDLDNVIKEIVLKSI